MQQNGTDLDLLTNILDIWQELAHITSHFIAVE
jgi:hypothetical protein